MSRREGEGKEASERKRRAVGRRGVRKELLEASLLKRRAGLQVKLVRLFCGAVRRVQRGSLHSCSAKKKRSSWSLFANREREEEDLLLPSSWKLLDANVDHLLTARHGAPGR